MDQWSPIGSGDVQALDVVARWPAAPSSVGVFKVAVDAPATNPPTLIGVTGHRTRPFPWASVTKPVTALAILVAVEEGTLSLDTPAGPPESTVRHLLAHASGLGLDGGVMDRPGARRIYSNAGYGVLAQVLEAQAGMDFGQYLFEAVLGPLRMDATTVHSEDDTPAAAAGLHGPLDDLLALISELVTPTLISTETADLAHGVSFTGLSGVLPGYGRFDPCDWGLGVEIRGDKHPHWTGTTNSPATFGHFGRSGSFFWVDPTAGVACCGLSDRPFGPWAAQAWTSLADAVLAEAVGFAA